MKKKAKRTSKPRPTSPLSARPRTTKPRAPKARPAKRRSLSAHPSEIASDSVMEPSTMVEVVAARDLFWQNVIRQILTSLSVEWLNRSRQASLPPGPGPQPPADSPVPPHENLFDGRLGILTLAGERIPIAQVYPVLACGIGSTDAAKLLSMAIECSVFQVRTPTGEVFTLPLSQMRGFHALTPELMKALEEAARREGDADEQAAPEGPGTPFGFAAFTSMERAGRERLHGLGYPQHAPDAPNPHPDE